MATLVAHPGRLLPSEPPVRDVARIDHLRGIGAPLNDAGAAPFQARAGSVSDVLALLAPDLADDADLVKAIEQAVR